MTLSSNIDKAIIAVDEALTTLSGIIQDETNIIIIYKTRQHVQHIVSNLKLLLISADRHMLQLAIDNRDYEFIQLNHKRLNHYDK